MRTVKNQTFENRRIKVDGTRFENCKFIGCEFVYCGGEMPLIIDCDVGNISFVFEGGAKRTIAWLRFLALNGGRDQINAMLTLAENKVN